MINRLNQQAEPLANKSLSELEKEFIKEFDVELAAEDAKTIFQWFIPYLRNHEDVEHWHSEAIHWHEEALRLVKIIEEKGIDVAGVMNSDSSSVATLGSSSCNSIEQKKTALDMPLEDFIKHLCGHAFFNGAVCQTMADANEKSFDAWYRTISELVEAYVKKLDDETTLLLNSQ